MMLKVGVLGAGFMGGTHARAYARLPEVQVVGVFSRAADKAAALAKEVGGEAFTDPMALVNHPDVEALSITLPTYLHRDFAVAALDAGKHVLVEKPMALSLADCDAMIEAAQRSGKILAVAQVLRFWPEYVALRDFVKSGELGRPLSAKATRLAEPPRWSEWFSRPEQSGGEILDLHIHDLDALNWLFGVPNSVYSLGQRGDTGGWDYALTLLDYGDIKCFAEGSAVMPGGYPFTASLWVLCERGSVEFNFRAGGVQVDARDTGGTSLMVYESGKAARALPCATYDAYDHEVATFSRCVAEGRAPEQGTAQQGRLAVQTALAARQSIETGQVVSF